MQEKYRRLKDEIYEQFARIGKAVSTAKRLEILDLLAQGERTVEVLAKEANLTVANASRHLHVLRDARLVVAEKSGVFVIYRLSDPAVGDFYRAMQMLAEQQLAEVEQLKKHFLEGTEGMEAMDRDTLMKKAHEGIVTVLDVRPVEEYNAGHLPGAISIPLNELENRLSELPHDQEVVAYCRGPYCVLAIKAVEMLLEKGFKAAHFHEGVPEWRSHGLPVETEKNQEK